MKTRKLTLIFLVLLFALLSSCVGASSKESEATNHVTSDSIAMSDSSVMDARDSLRLRQRHLAEAVLNLTDFKRFSKITGIRSKYGIVSICFPNQTMFDSTTIIFQDSVRLKIIDKPTDDKPCYVFDKFNISGDSAYVHVIMTITNAVAFGSLKYTKSEWVPSNDFLIGVH